MAATEQAPTEWVIFSYGSNSTKQLQKRVENFTLTSEPAVLENYSRCFCLRAKRWGGGGVASLCPDEGSRTYGSVVRLTTIEKERLDKFELPAYRLEPIAVAVDGGTANVSAYCYIANDQDGAWTPAMTAEPSEPYLVAIHHMLAEHWPLDNETIAVRSFGGAATTVVREWSKPPPLELTDLGSIVVEINMRRATPWEMPRTIGEVVAKLNDVGIANVTELAAAVSISQLDLGQSQSPPAGSLNAALRDKGHKELSQETLEIIAQLLV